MNSMEKALKMLEKARLEGSLLAFESVIRIINNDADVPEHTKEAVRACVINTSEALKELAEELKN